VRIPSALGRPPKRMSGYNRAGENRDWLSDKGRNDARSWDYFTHGGPEVLRIIELPEVHAGPGQVRIRVHAATANPTDVGVRNGTRAEQQQADPPAYVPGMEAAGIVDEGLESEFLTGLKGWRRRHGDRGAERQPWRVS